MKAKLAAAWRNDGFDKRWRKKKAAAPGQQGHAGCHVQLDDKEKEQEAGLWKRGQEAHQGSEEDAGRNPAWTTDMEKTRKGKVHHQQTETATTPPTQGGGNPA